MLREMRKPRITIVGAGNLGSALALALSEAGYSISEIVVRGVSSRKRRVAKLAKTVGTRLAAAEEVEPTSEVTWLAVSDGAIRQSAGELARRGAWKGRIALHSSGALSSDELASLRRRGASVASAHPMMTFVGASKADFDGIAWTLEGDARAVRAANKIIRDLGGVPFQIEKRNKARYHAFGAFLSPLLVVQLSAAATLAQAAGIPRKELTRFMQPIVRRTLENIYARAGEPGGMGRAFSGPLVRGDVKTIELHLKALRKVPQVRKLYIALLAAALQSDLPIQRREQLRRLLSRA